ncbi:MAG: hypothetical protein FJ267_18385, partial [Planctomycetes bacterium]|nr:hypothetical protein [Planctomycetota bacterium]
MSDPTFSMSSKLQRINAERACSWLAIANDEDFLWTPQEIDSSFFSEIASLGLPHIVPILTSDAITSDVEMVPWGWTNETRIFCEKHRLESHAP